MGGWFEKKDKSEKDDKKELWGLLKLNLFLVLEALICLSAKRL